MTRSKQIQLLQEQIEEYENILLRLDLGDEIEGWHAIIRDIRIRREQEDGSCREK